MGLEDSTRKSSHRRRKFLFFKDRGKVFIEDEEHDRGKVFTGDEDDCAYGAKNDSLN